MRFELTDAQYARLQPLLPRSGRGGQWKDHRTIINGVLWIARTGAAWRDMPSRYGPWQTVYDRFNYWRRNGQWRALLAALQADFDAEIGFDWRSFFIDSTVVRASRAAAGGGKRGVRMSRSTMPSVARAAASAPRSTSSAMVAARS